MVDYVVFSHARKHFVHIDDSEQLKLVKNCMGLLAFSSETQLEPYKVGKQLFLPAI